jgi:hypothetical protein
VHRSKSGPLKSESGQTRPRWSKPRERACPLRAESGQVGRHLAKSALCRYCCKSPKSPGDNFPAIRRSDRRPPICVVSITLPRSPVSLSSGDEVPHIFTRKSRLQPGEFLITSAKRLLQHNLPKGDICSAAKTVAIRSLRRPRFAERDTLWMLCRSVRQSGLAPENFTTLAHFSISKRIEIT